jgi:MYXO-CTERM domain-containing protein
MQRKTTLTCLLFSLLGAASYSASAAPTYTISPAGLLSSPYVVDVTGSLNNSGQIGGYSFDNNQFSRALVYSNGTRTSLDPAGAVASRGTAINDAGTVVGTVTHGDGNDHATVFLGNGAAIDLGTLGGSSSYANGISNAGTVVGTSYVAADSTFHAFVTQGGKLVDIGTLVGSNGFSEAYAINDQGLAVGYSLASDGGQHAFSYANGTMSDLGTLGGLNSLAYAVNGSGAIAGYSYLAGDALEAHAFVYANGKMTDLGTMGATVSFAYDINDAGDVVGRLETDNPDGSMGNQAFLYSGGQMTDLNSLIDPASGWNLQWASAINDKGQIAARGCQLDGSCQDLLLTRVMESGDPASNVPEPEAFTAGLAGLALFGLLRRRRNGR